MKHITTRKAGGFSRSNKCITPNKKKFHKELLNSFFRELVIKKG